MSQTNQKIENSSWDKVFPKSEKINVEKISLKNRFGITLIGDLYSPKNIGRAKKLSAVAISGPLGAVKEQSSGLYAQTLAESGFIALAFDRRLRAKVSERQILIRKIFPPQLTAFPICPMSTPKESVF